MTEKREGRTATGEFSGLLALSALASPGAVGRLRDSPAQEMSAYGYGLLLMAQYLRQEEPELWALIERELAADLEEAQEKTRRYHRVITRTLQVMVEEMQDQLQAESDQPLPSPASAN